MSKAILDALNSRLDATAALATIVGSKIYLQEGPTDVNPPLLVYKATAVRTTPYFGAVTRVEIDLDFIFHLGNVGTATGYTAAAALATALSTPLTSVTGYDRVRFTQVESGVPSFEDDSWSIVERYRAIAHDT